MDHLQRRGNVPGAGCHDPEDGVVSPAHVSVRQMLAFLRTPTPVDSACSAKPVSLPMAARVAPPSDGGGTDEPISAAPVDASPEPATLLRRGAQPEMQDIAFDVEGSPLDEELEQRAEIYQTNDQPSAASHEDEDDEPHQCFGTMPRFELAKYRTDRVKQANVALQDEGSETAQDVAERTRRLGFHEHEVTRVYTLDPVSDELVSSSDQVYLTKVFDGKSKPKRLPVALAPERVTQHRAAGRRGASRRTVNVSSMEDAPRSVLQRAEADAGFVMHSTDAYQAPPHAEVAVGSMLWTDLGRDDELPVLHTRSEQADVSPMQDLQIQDHSDPAAWDLRRNRELDHVLEEVQHLEDKMNAQFRLSQGGEENTAPALPRQQDLDHLRQKVQQLEDESVARSLQNQREEDEVGVYF